MQTFEREMISRRRAFRVLGSGIGFGLGVLGLLFATSNAEALTPGMERRQDRRADRRERREDRRTNRQDRCDNRRSGGQECE